MAALAALAAAAALLPAAAARAGDDLVLLPGVDELEAAEALDPVVPGFADDAQLVLSASRVGVPLAEAPGIVTVIRAAELRAMGARHLYDALRYQPELDVTRDAFGFHHVAVRGRKVDTEVLVLLDGHRINDPYDGRILYEIPIAQVDRIEILRGPGSALYGSNAFAGVIAVYTRRRTGSHYDVSYRSSGGDRNNTDLSRWSSSFSGVRALPRSGRVFWSGELEFDQGAQLLVPEDSLTRNRFDPDDGSSQSRSCNNLPTAACPATAYSYMPRTLARGTLGFELRPGLVVDLHGISVHRGPFIGEFDTLTPDSWLQTDRAMGAASYDRALRHDLSLRSRSSLDLTDIDREIQVAPDGFKELVEGSSEIFPDGQLKQVHYRELVARQDLSVKWDPGRRNILVVGAELAHIRMLDYDFATNYDDAGRRQDQFGNHFDFELPQDGATRTVLGVYVEDLYAAPHGLNLVAGGRVDVYSDFGTAISPRAGAVWRRGDLIAKLFYGWAFRAPTFQELYDQTGRIDLGQFVGNPDLKASRIRTLEASVSYTRPLDAVLLEVNVTGAYSQIRDSIDRAPLSGLDNTFLNTSDIDSGAASAEIRLDWSGRLAAFANGSWQLASADYEYVNPAAGLNIRTDTRLENVPPYRFNAGLHGHLTDRLSAGVRAEVGGRRRNNERTPLEAQHFFDYPPYALLSAHARFDDIIWKQMYVAVDAVNLTNAAVADEPFRPNRMPLGIPRDRLRLGVTFGMDF